MSANLNCTYNVRTLYVQCPLGGCFVWFSVQKKLQDTLSCYVDVWCCRELTWLGWKVLGHCLVSCEYRFGTASWGFRFCRGRQILVALGPARGRFFWGQIKHASWVSRSVSSLLRVFPHPLVQWCSPHNSSKQSGLPVGFCVSGSWTGGCCPLFLIFSA